MSNQTHKPHVHGNRLILGAERLLQKLVQGIKRATGRLDPVLRRQLLKIGCAAIVIICVLYAAIFFWPRSVAFSYAHDNCFFNPVVLPDLLKKEPSTSFAVQLKPTISIADYPIYSATTCIDLSGPPQESVRETVRLAPFGAAISQSIHITAGDLPRLQSAVALNQPLAPKGILYLQLNQADTQFDYTVTANNATALCAKKDMQILCDLGPLGLAQGAEYPLTVARLFKGGAVGSLLTKTITTVTPITVAATSIAPNETVFGIPTQLTVTFNKPLRSAQNVQLTHGGGSITTTPTINGPTLTLTFAQPLPRMATFQLALHQLEAEDGGFLNAPHLQTFTTSGGPKVQTISIGSARVQPSSGFTITFDSTVGSSQDLQKFVRVEAGGARLAANLTLRGKSITITPQGLNRCTPFSVKILDGLQNDAGVTGGSAWQFNSRTVCQDSFSIGTSARGRSIMAHRFGNGPNKIIFVGTLHGDEKSATHTLNSFISYLESNYDRLPAHRTIIVVPSVNPDGYATNSRTNANGVDLNRNFPANGWKSGVTMPDGSYLPQGGGAAPLSEPESSALANFISAQAPRLVLSYHSIAGLVAANEAGDSLAQARSYGRLARLPAYGNEASSSFHYDTTGAFEDWLRDRNGIAGLLIELSTKASNEFGRHRTAMWTMATLP